MRNVCVQSNCIKCDINVDRVEESWISSTSEGICELSRAHCIGASFQIPLFFAINFVFFFLFIDNTDLYN